MEILQQMDVILVVAMLVAYIVKGMTGFANTLVFGTVLSFTRNNINITPVELVTACVSNIIIAWQERKHISVKMCIPIICLLIIGNIPGIIFLKMGDATIIKIFFGVVVVLLAVEMYFRGKKPVQKETNKYIMAAIGLVSGLLCGLFGIGALVTAYMARKTSDPKEFRGNMCAVFTVENTFRIIVYFCTGILNWELFKSAIFLLPLMLIGLYIGIYLSKKINKELTKNIMIIALILSGLSLVITNLI